MFFMNLIAHVNGYEVDPIPQDKQYIGLVKQGLFRKGLFKWRAKKHAARKAAKSAVVEEEERKGEFVVVRGRKGSNVVERGEAKVAEESGKVDVEEGVMETRLEVVLEAWCEGEKVEGALEGLLEAWWKDERVDEVLEPRRVSLGQVEVKDVVVVEQEVKELPVAQVAEVVTVEKDRYRPGRRLDTLS